MTTAPTDTEAITAPPLALPGADALSLACALLSRLTGVPGVLISTVPQTVEIDWSTVEMTSGHAWFVDGRVSVFTTGVVR